MNDNGNTHILKRFLYAIIGLFVVCIVLYFSYETIFHLLPYLFKEIIKPICTTIGKATGVNGNFLFIPSILFFIFQNFLAYKISTHILEDEYEIRTPIFIAPLVFITAIPLVVLLYLLLVLEYIGKAIKPKKTKIILLALLLTSLLLSLLF